MVTRLQCAGGLPKIVPCKMKRQRSSPNEKVIYIEGKVEETIPSTIPDQIALLRLDTDWYESTKHELNNLYPILSKNGVLIVDDYGFWAGSKKATDEYFVDKPILLNRVDQEAVIGIKI